MSRQHTKLFTPIHAFAITVPVLCLSLFLMAWLGSYSHAQVAAGQDPLSLLLWAAVLVVGNLAVAGALLRLGLKGPVQMTETSSAMIRKAASGDFTETKVTVVAQEVEEVFGSLSLMSRNLRELVADVKPQLI